jgi:hypothetical protein
MGSPRVGFPRASACRTTVAAALLALGAFSLPATGEAQTATGERRTILSINPLGLPLEYVSAELEHKTSNFSSLGASISYFGLDDDAVFSMEGKLRLYPNEQALRAFSVGLAAGVARVEDTFFDGTSDDERASWRPTIHVLADYNWLLGRSRRVLVGTGVGIKRIFGDDDNFGDIPNVYPTVRFQVGVLF